jgi:hypothetical protein
MVAHMLRMYERIRPTISQLLCVKQAAAAAAAAAAAPAALGMPAASSQQQQQQQQTSKEAFASAISAVPARVLLGSSSILLQQLLRMAAAAAAAAAKTDMQQQQLMLTAAILYCADALGGQVKALWFDLCLNEAEGIVEDCLLPHSNQNASTLAMAVQAFEAAVRHLLAAAPPTAAGSTMPVGSSSSSSGSSGRGSSSGGGGSSSGGGGGSSRRPVVPPSIVQVELSAFGIYCAVVKYARGDTTTTTATSSSSSTSSSRDLSRPQQQLLQASLSMLLTASKLWQAGLQPPLSMMQAQYLAGEAEYTVRKLAQLPLYTDSSGVDGTPSTEAAAAALMEAVAAAVAAALAPVGGVQVCHLVSRYTSSAWSSSCGSWWFLGMQWVLRSGSLVLLIRASPCCLVSPQTPQQQQQQAAPLHPRVYRHWAH